MIRWLLIATLATGCSGYRKAVRDGDAKMEAGKSSAAVRAYKSAVKKKPGKANAQRKLAEALIAAGRPEDARKPAQEALDLGDDSARVPLAESMVWTWDPEGALTVLGDLDTPEAAGVRCAANVVRAWYEKSRVDCTRSDGREPLSAWGAARLGEGQKVESIVESVAPSIRDGRVLLQLAAALSHIGSDEAALDLVAQAKGLDSTLGLSETTVKYQLQAKAAHDAGWDDAGLWFALQAALLSPEDGEVAWQVGRQAYRAEAWDLSARYLQSALELPPYEAPEQGSGTVVVVTSTSGLSAKERNAARTQIANVLADTQARSGNAGASLEALLTKAKASGDPGDYLRYAEAMLKGGKADEAYQTARGLGTTPGASAVAAQALVQLGRPSEAMGYAQRAWKEDPSNAAIGVILGRLLIEDERYADAFEVVERTLNANPANRELQALLEAARSGR